MPAPHSEHPQQVRIALGERSYDIQIGAGLLARPGTWEGLPAAAAALIVTNTRVGPLYSARLREALAPHYLAGFEVVDADMPAFRAFLDELAYPYTPEYDNPAYKFFLG